MDVMAGQARHSVDAPNGHVADIFEHMALPRIERRNGVVREVDLKVFEEIVPWDEIVRIGKAAALGLASTNMALRTDGSHDPRLLDALFAEIDQASIVGMLERHLAVAGKTIDRRRPRRPSLGIDGAGVATGAAIAKTGRVPVRRFPMRHLRGAILETGPVDGKKVEFPPFGRAE